MDQFGGQWHGQRINQAIGKPFQRSTEYSLWDKLRYFRGVAFSQQAREKMTSVNVMERIPHVEVPVQKKV